MQIRHGFFQKKIFIYSHTLLYIYGCSLGYSFAPRLVYRPTHTPPTDQARRRVDPGHAPTHEERTHPAHHTGHTSGQHTPHHHAGPLPGCTRTPYPHISSPPAPRARRRPRSVAASFPRERHFPRAVHRPKISVLALFSYRVNIVAKNI